MKRPRKKDQMGACQGSKNPRSSLKKRRTGKGKTNRKGKDARIPSKEEW